MLTSGLRWVGRAGPPGRRALAGALVVTAGSLVAVAAFAVLRAPSGHPGGRVLHQLQPAVAALPDGARVSYRHDVEPRWDSCDGRQGTFGWGDATVQVRFTSNWSASALLAHADRVLRGLGWAPALRDATGAPVAWTKALDRGTTARATLERSPADAAWTLFVLAPPAGPPARGC